MANGLADDVEVAKPRGHIGVKATESHKQSGGGE